MRGKRGGKVGRPKKNPSVVPCSVVQTLSFPVTDRDDNAVECSVCHEQSTFREFRIHNLTAHYNLATTTDNNVKQDYRFFNRQLNDMAKIMKITNFKCPRDNCTAYYKSSLGLGYHLETCGKSAEELKANLVQCEICKKSYTVANIGAHRKLHNKKDKEQEELPKKLSHRESAKRAQKKLKKLTTKEGSDDDDDEEEDSDNSEEFILSEVRDSLQSDVVPSNTEVPLTLPQVPDDIFSYAYRSLVGTNYLNDAWEKQIPISDNIFHVLPFNVLTPREDCEPYLPDFLTSFKFQTKDKNKTTCNAFHQLRIFESEVVKDRYGNKIVNAGGPISALSWHASGKYLALATLKNHSDLPDVHSVEFNRTCIQIYENNKGEDVKQGLNLKLVLGIDNGFVHHIQWSNYSSEPSDADPTQGKLFGHLAYAGGDSSINILFLRNVDVNSVANCFSEEASVLIPFYIKVPEITLLLPVSMRKEVGHCVTFDWSEKFKYFAAGYGNGTIALFNLLHSSKLLKKRFVDGENNNSTEIYPIWYIQAHTDTISSIFFNPSNPKYLVTASYDYHVKTWDTDLRTEIEDKKIGMVLDACWIRGWATCAISVEYVNTTFQIGAFNMIKFYPVGNSKGFTNCADNFNVTSVSFFEGLVAQGSEVGKVTITYFDQFLRECDYDRNKKKRNVVDFSSISLAKKKNSNVTSDEVMEPRLIITFLNNRRETTVSIHDPTSDDAENYNVYYNFIRINQVSWNPLGNNLATGYHNGLLTISPISFKDLYPAYKSLDKSLA